MAEITLLATWPAQDNAEGYRVRLLDSQGVEIQLQDVATTSAAFGPLVELTTYQIEMVAYHAADESEPQLLTLTTPGGEEGASSLLARWEAPASGDTARLLDETGAELQDLGAVTAPITLTGLATDVGYQLELTRSGGTAEVIAFTTPVGPPGVTNIQHTFTTDSLTFTWEGTSDPDQYHLTLSRDGAEVESKTLSLVETEKTTTFTATGSLNWTVPDGVSEVEVLLVGGGGGGGGGPHGGGGGAGGVLHIPSYDVSGKTSIAIEVGAGGAGYQGTNSSPWPSPGTNKGANGGDSVFDGKTALGGGGGGGYSGGAADDTPGQDGGSGGGGTDESAAGAGLQPGSTDGGQGSDGGTSTQNEYSKAGGGAGERGDVRGDGYGGDGVYVGDNFGDAFGEAGWVAGGGGGSFYGNTSPVSDTGGQGGGGNSGSEDLNLNPESGMANTGGGGGGAERNGTARGGDGGSGLVLIRYSAPPSSTTTLSFGGLEDGTQYDLAIQASNVQGAGPIAYYQAATGYIAPAAPVNLRQFEERIIAVICRWDLAEPDKVFDVEVQLLYGTDLVLADALEGAANERTIIVPMASTDYLLRVRAGNPGGWSPWAEATVHSEVFPIIDSRLAVMAAGYQEDVLHTDTWDGGTDAAGHGVPQRVDLDLGFALSAIYNDGYSDDTQETATTPLVQLGSITSEQKFYSYSDDTQEKATSPSVQLGNIASFVLQIEASDSDEDAVSPSVVLGSISSIKKLFEYSDLDNPSAISCQVSLGSITSYPE